MNCTSCGKLSLSGETFTATYHLSGSAIEAEAMAHDLCVEQTVEFPLDLINREDIVEGIVGEVRRLNTISKDLHEAIIEFPVDIVGGELTQLLNVLFGNSSLKPGIRLVDVELPKSLLLGYPGPRYGRQRLRRRLGVADRPLLATALKPMGLSPGELASLAEQWTLGGIDIIKDDHGLTNQAFCPFEERVRRCVEAIKRAARRRGRPCLYFPNATAPSSLLQQRVELAQQAGADGVVLAPGLIGFDAMAQFARDKNCDLAIMSHPAFQGSAVVSSRSGIAHGILFGLFSRLAGADATIFPHAGGRFSFSERQCQDIVEWTKRDLFEISTIFPVPAGGMTLDRVEEMIRFYGRDVVLLIGGDLGRHGSTLAESCQRFHDLILLKP